MFSSRLLSVTTLLAVVCLLGSAAHADDRYQRYFHGAYRACSDRFPPDTVSASLDYAVARENCYADEVRRALAMLPPDSPQLMIGALQAVPDYAHATFDAALAAGVDPYFAVTAATRTLPEYDRTFASRAIARGADPSQVTEATAAGHRYEKQ